MSRTRVMRKGSSLIEIRSYAPGDGFLSFVAIDTRTLHAEPDPPTEEECKQVCPYGWILFQEGPNWRARKV